MKFYDAFDNEIKDGMRVTLYHVNEGELDTFIILTAHNGEYDDDLTGRKKNGWYFVDDEGFCVDALEMSKLEGAFCVIHNGEGE